MKSIFWIASISILSHAAARAIGDLEKSVEFIILHNNDMHARFEEISANGTKCSSDDANSHKCYGGFARVAYEVRMHRNNAKNGGIPVLYLNAGDTYTGTSWFRIFKDNITAAFLNKLRPDAVSLGNHELDENVKGLIPFLNHAEFPVLACNLDLRNVPELAAAQNLRNSTILNVGGRKVGVIGYLTPDTKFLAVPNDVEYIPEIEAINLEAAKLKEQGISIIIALGHSGYKKDQDIARNCPEVDVVIGGHTNTFLYNGNQPDLEKIQGPYPLVVQQSTGKKVPVVQAYAYTKYLGKLHVQFDTAGNLVEFDGQPLILNASINSEDDVLQLLEVYRPNITALKENIVGHTKVYLEGNSKVCRRFECNLGNLIADSMVYARVLERNTTDLGWTDAAVSFIMGGGIRSSIEKRPDGSITEEDVTTVLPFNNDLVITSIKGSTLRQALERSATVRNGDSNGAFLQMSGVRTLYDYNEPEGKRVKSVEVRCADCGVPRYELLENNRKYKVIVPNFLLNGGDGHRFNENDTERLKANDLNALISYLQRHEFVYPELESRITIVLSEKGGSVSLHGSMFLVAISVFCFIWNN